MLTFNFENTTGLTFFSSKDGITTFVNVSLSRVSFSISLVMFRMKTPSYLGHLIGSQIGLHGFASQETKSFRKLIKPKVTTKPSLLNFTQLHILLSLEVNFDDITSPK